jgi:tetratricopeptide (TPR) repeat protein
MHAVAPELDAEVTQRLARFVSLYPENALANYYYAVSLWNRVRGDTDPTVYTKVEELLKRALRSDPALADAHFQLGILYEDRKQPENAIREYQAALRTQPGLKTAHYRLAQLYSATGEKELARRELQLYRVGSSQ